MSTPGQPTNSYTFEFLPRSSRENSAPTATTVSSDQELQPRSPTPNLALPSDSQNQPVAKPIRQQPMDEARQKESDVVAAVPVEQLDLTKDRGDSPERKASKTQEIKSSSSMVVGPQRIPPAAMVTSETCAACGEGKLIREERPVCAACGRLRPIVHGHRLDASAFQWALDGQAMQKLKSVKPLNAVAQRISDQVGRRWIEATFPGVRLSPTQMPGIYQPALHAARLLGLPRMPDIYVSGERPWDALTFGSDNSAFIVMGSALVTSFRGPELGFLFAREMGHILAGHALWKTVIRFLVGEHNPRSGLLKNGLVGLLDPGKWIEGAIEVPLLGWARQAEVTADRAGLLTVRNLEVVRRVLLSWAFKSPALYPLVNQQEWMRQQQEDSADESAKLTEMVSSSTPYITRRLKHLSEYATSEEFRSTAELLSHASAKHRQLHVKTSEQASESTIAGLQTAVDA